VLDAFLVHCQEVLHDLGDHPQALAEGEGLPLNVLFQRLFLLRKHEYHHSIAFQSEVFEQFDYAWRVLQHGNVFYFVHKL